MLVQKGLPAEGVGVGLPTGGYPYGGGLPTEVESAHKGMGSTYPPPHPPRMTHASENITFPYGG